MSLFQSLSGFLSSAIGSTEQLVSQHTGLSSNKNNADAFDYSPLTFFKDQNASLQKLENTHSENKFFSGTQVISSPFQTLKEASSLLPSKLTPVVEVFQTAISSAQSSINTHSSSSLTSSPASSSTKFSSRREETNKFNSFAQLSTDPGPSNQQSSPGMGMDVDLSHLSEEERLQIEAVMARAMGVETTLPPNQNNSDAYLPQASDSSLGQFNSYQAYERSFDGSLYQQDFVLDQEHLNSFAKDGMAISNKRNEDFNAYNSSGFRQYDDYLKRIEYQNEIQSANQTMDQSEARYMSIEDEKGDVASETGRIMSPDGDDVEHFECVICSMMKIKDQDDAICSDCRRANICFECGTSDNQEGVWLCNVCRKRRDLMNATTKWRLQQQEDEMSTSVFASRSTSSSAKMFEQLADLTTLQQQQSLPSGSNRHAELQRQASLHISGSYADLPSSTTNAMAIITTTTTATTTSANCSCLSDMIEEKAETYGTNFDQYPSCNASAQSDSYILTPLQPAGNEPLSVPYSSIYSESQPTMREQFDFMEKGRRLSDPVSLQSQVEEMSRNLPPSTQVLESSISDILKPFPSEETRSYDGGPFDLGFNDDTFRINQGLYQIVTNAPPSPPPISLPSSSTSSSVANTTLTSHQLSFFPDKKVAQESIVCASNQHPQNILAIVSSHNRHDQDMPLASTVSASIFSKSEVTTAKSVKVPPIEKVGYADPELLQSPKRSPKSLSANFTSSNASWSRHRDSSPLYRPPAFSNNLPSNDRAPLQMLIKTSALPWTNNFNNSIGSMAGSCDYEICVDSYNLSGDYFSGLMEAQNHFIFNTPPSISQMKDDAKIFLPPQKPARFSSNDPQRFDQAEGDTLASFAASIASDTALLTNTMSVSPMIEVKRGPEIIGPTSQLFAEFSRKTEDYLVNNQPFRNNDPLAVENQLLSQYDHIKHLTNSCTSEVQSKNVGLAGKSIFSSNHKPITRHGAIPTYPPVAIQGRIPINSQSDQERLKQSIMKRAPRYENLSKITADSSYSAQPKTTDVVVGSSSAMEHVRRAGVCKPPDSTASLMDLRSSVTSIASFVQSNLVEENRTSEVLLANFTTSSSDERNEKSKASYAFAETASSPIVMMTPITSVNIFLSNFMKEDSDKDKQASTSQTASSASLDTIQRQSNEPIDLSICSNANFSSKSSSSEQNSRVVNSMNTPLDIIATQSTSQCSTLSRDSVSIHSSSKDNHENFDVPPTTYKYAFEGNMNLQTGIASTKSEPRAVTKSNNPSSITQNSPQDLSNSLSANKKAQKRLPAIPMDTKSSEPSHNPQVTFDMEKKQNDNAFEADSNLIGHTDLSDIDSKKTLSMVLMSISGQVSVMGKHEKTHRKLPPTPDQLPVSKTRLRSKSADSRKQQEESVETVKERLRRHLRTKEIHKRGGSSSEKSEDEEDSSDASNASSRFFTAGSASFRQRSTSFGANFGMTKERSSLKTPTTSRAKSVGRQSRLDVFVNSKAISTHERFNNRAEPDNQNKYKSNIPANKFKTSRSLAHSATNVNNFAKYNKPQVEMVAFHGIQVPIEIKSLKQRIREELQIVTASRRLRLDEEEEVRRMEAEMAEREKKRIEWRPTYEKRYRSNSPVIHISKESYDHEPMRSVSNKNDIINKYHKKQSQNSKKSFIPINNKRSRQETTPGKHKNYLYSSKPHSFKRQNSDPLISNLVTDTMSSGKTSYSERQHGRNYLDYEGIDRKLSDRHYDVQRIQGRKYMPKGFAGRSGYMDATPQGYGSLSRSSDLLFKHVKPSLANSHSEANLLRDGWSGEAELEERDIFHRRFLRTPSFSHMEENENPLLREEKKEQLRLEIELRKLQLEEARYLQEQIQRLMAMPDVTSTDISRARSLYQKRRRLDSQIYPFRSSEPGFIPNSEADNYQQKNCSVKDTNKSSTFSGLAFASNQNVTDFSKLSSIGKEGFQRSASPESDENLIEVGSHGQPTKSNGVVRKQTRQYSFPTKTILITRDLKDKYLEGFGIGVKITGGQFLDREGQMGAFVTTIYKGGAADQLHGELREGDQVLEWNGHPLTGKSQEEIDRIMSYSNGEIELVIRANESSISSKPSSIRSTLHTDSETSFLGNDNQSDRTFTDREIRKQISKPYCSPPLSPTSSQQDLFSESSVLSSANSSKSDAGSPNECYNLPTTESYDYHNEKTVSRSKNDKHLRHLDGYNSRNKLEAIHGEIQLQLSYDTYDSTLNVHVIQAKGLQALDSRNQLDSFAKVQLIPLTNQAHKRCTKYISRNLNPEWHQTLVFMGVPRMEISQKSLEISVWDFDKFKNHQFLGEVLISLSDSRCLDNRPHWYQLQRSKKKHVEEEIKFTEENGDGGDSKRGHRHHDKDQKKGSEGGNLSRHRNLEAMKENTHKSRSGRHAKNAKTDCEERVDSSDNTSQHDTGFGGDGSQDSMEKSDKGNKEERITDNLRESLFSENSLVSLQSSMRSGKLKPTRPQPTENRGIVNAQKTIFSKILSGIVSMMFKSFSCCQYTAWKDKHETIPMNRIEIRGSHLASP